MAKGKICKKIPLSSAKEVSFEFSHYEIIILKSLSESDKYNLAIVWSKDKGVNSFPNKNVIKICFSNIKIKVASRYSVNIMINNLLSCYYWFLLNGRTEYRVLL